MLPLANRRILITRAAGQASTLATLLEARGAQTIQIPTIEIAPPSSYCALDAALTTLRAYDLLIFTSANAVAAFAARARQLNLSPHPKRVAVIGPATAKALEQCGIAADDPVPLMPARYVAESLVEALLPIATGSNILLVRAAVARDILPDALTAAGASVTLADAYQTIVPTASIDHLRNLFATAPPDAITFTSASKAINLLSLLDRAGLAIPAGVVLASIGPITSRALLDLDLEPTIEAAESTIPALVNALIYQLSPLTDVTS